MTRRFERARPGELATDAVVVTVRKVHGRLMGEVACTHCPAAEEYAVADFPRPILVALERAEELREICNLHRVMVSLPPGEAWDPDWGELLEPRQAAGSPHRVPSDSRHQAAPPRGP